jgi:hypothetical protein
MALALIDPRDGLLRRRVAGTWQPWPAGDDRSAVASTAVLARERDRERQTPELVS